MAKKHQYRASAEEKRKRKEAMQKQKAQDFFRKHTLHLIIAAAVLVAVIVVAVLISNNRYYAGSLEVKDNAIVGMEENWLVRNMGDYNRPKYFKLAEVNLPENYKSNGPLTSDPLENNFFMAALDENALMNQYTVLAMKDTDAKTTSASALLNSTFIREGEMHEISRNDKPVYVTIGVCENFEYDDQGNPIQSLGYYKLITASMDCAMNSCIKVTALSPDYATLEEMPSDTDVLAALEPILATITLEEN